MYGDEGIFYADFGDNFTYKEDKQADASKGTNGSATATAAGSSSAENKDAQKIKTICFPALEVVLAKRWCEVTSRHFPLDKTFVKHRLLSAFRYWRKFHCLLASRPRSCNAFMSNYILADKCEACNLCIQRAYL